MTIQKHVQFSDWLLRCKEKWAQSTYIAAVKAVYIDCEWKNPSLVPPPSLPPLLLPSLSPSLSLHPSPSIPLPQSPSPPLSLHPSLHYLSYTTETYAHTYTYTHTVQTITQCVQHTVSWDTCPSAAATALADHQQHSTARDPTETDAPLDRYSPHIPPVPLSATGI